MIPHFNGRVGGSFLSLALLLFLLLLGFPRNCGGGANQRNALYLGLVQNAHVERPFGSLALTRLSPSPLHPTPLLLCLFRLIVLFHFLVKALCSASNYGVQRFVQWIFCALSEHICIFLYRLMSLLLWIIQFIFSSGLPVG